ncbi:hypothetical protein [Campylobacter canadensis]|uniref:Uncharacterized protein n=1 Tax=Campylobacter canadensis TaxID=449520 RepID=A0ABS7WTB7_9BACT|nr:hypothetical protein [Campylobacter canadensis]MBZ7988020.1 hypothetical protein [Campylobacter canadensis]MBZ7995454.1 hypothetical protein [Campylobacter canadensis]MBZ7996573.1 hypothetical protein [Campylobacter canadensis]MBZ7998983.1 hypothetical protein [Campylobacter canadensis]MBZ8000767.1 hypothetical protein [Campylobacter canadensis]
MQNKIYIIADEEVSKDIASSFKKMHIDYAIVTNNLNDFDNFACISLKDFTLEEKVILLSFKEEEFIKNIYSLKEQTTNNAKAKMLICMNNKLNLARIIDAKYYLSINFNKENLSFTSFYSPFDDEEFNNLLNKYFHCNLIRSKSEEELQKIKNFTNNHIALLSFVFESTLNAAFSAGLNKDLALKLLKQNSTIFNELFCNFNHPNELKEELIQNNKIINSLNILEKNNMRYAITQAILNLENEE